MGPIGQFAAALLCGSRFDEAFRATQRRGRGPLGSSRTVARHGLRAAPEPGTKLDGRTPVRGGGVAAWTRLERRGLPRDSLACGLFRRPARVAARADALRGG
jgi:hypothetical protein